MLDAKRMAKEARDTGRVWVVGEMDFDCNQGVAVATEQAQAIADQCGYLATRQRGSAILTIYPPYSSQYVSLDWISPERPNLVCVTVWTPQSAHV